MSAETKKAAYKKWRSSEKGKAWAAKYERSAKVKAFRRRFRQSAEGKLYHLNYRKNLRHAALIHYSGNPPSCQCPGCRENHLEFLSIDHIEGGGNKHRRDINKKGGVGFHIWLKRNKYPSGFRILCYNCNLAISHCGYCPHERESNDPR